MFAQELNNGEVAITIKDSREDLNEEEVIGLINFLKGVSHRQLKTYITK